MNNTVLLIKEWVEFEEIHPEGSIEDFCRDYLSEKNESKRLDVDPECHPNYQKTYALTKIINRLSRLWMYFTLQAIKPIGLTSFDEFVFLFTVDLTDSIRKKDLIYMHFIEISSGLLVIERLIKKDYLSEEIHPQDKRSKKVSITKKGKDTLAACKVALIHVAEDLYGEMAEKEMSECIQFLSPIEKRIANQWNRLKKFEPILLPNQK